MGDSRMHQSKLFKLNAEINQFFDLHKKDNKALSENLLFKNKLINQTNLENEWQDKNNLSRKLRIGIIGRVKAGKSSLLNTLFFNGENILPQAATPMTAALTIMKYGEERKAEVEFYSNEDIKILEEHDQVYKRELKAIIERELFQNGSDEIVNSIQQDKGRLAKLEKDITRDFNHANPILVSAHEQIEAMKQYPLDEQERRTVQTLTATSHQKLMNELHAYVGNHGKYTPYTKSVTLYLNEESLKDLEVIDTPGVNDPVASREERTHEFLKQCDVVFVVSPSGQFLSHEDLALMQRITVNEGIQEIYLVASQVDNELCTPSEGGYGESLAKVLENITQKLTKQAYRVFNTHPILSQNSNLCALFQKHQIICTSSMAFKMHKAFSNKAEWSGDIQKVWNNLEHYYHDYLTPDDTAQHYLEKIANISGLKAVLEEVRANKDEIRARNQANFIETKKNNFLELLNEVNDYFNKSIMKVETTTSKEAEDQLAHIRSFQAEAKAGIDTVYKGAITTITQENGWGNSLDEIVDNSINEFFNANRTYDAERTKEVRNESSFLNLFGLFAGTHTERYTVTAINATQIKEILNSVRNKVARNLNVKRGELKQDWEEALVRDVFRMMDKFNRDVENGEKYLRDYEIKLPILEIVTNLPIRRIVLNDDIPLAIKNKSGELTSDSARKFQEAANDYIQKKLIQNLKHDNQEYVEQLKGALNSISLGEKITSILEKQAVALEKEIKNETECLARYRHIQDGANQLIQKVQQEL